MEEAIKSRKCDYQTQAGFLFLLIYFNIYFKLKGSDLSLLSDVLQIF